MNPTLHILSFDVPYPANYGGVIDVYHKLRALHDAGVSIILHCFTDQREPAPELNELCTEVNYYPRKSGIRNVISLTPYIVASRTSEDLRNRLLQDTHPILFEGLHTCDLLSDPALKNRVKIYRESNIEHRYYYHLFKAAANPADKCFFLAETVKLRWFQNVLEHAGMMLVVSEEDQHYLRKVFPRHDIRYLPSFHRDDKVTSKTGRGTYILYHGKLSVPENYRAAEYIISHIYTNEMPPLVIAGLDPPRHLAKIIEQHPNIRLEPNPDDSRMAELIREAQIHLMVTAQPTGLKLKLLNALFHGRHCLVNQEMLAGTRLHPVCHIAGSPGQFRGEIIRLFHVPFEQKEIERRETVLMESYSNKKNCKMLTDILTLL